MNDSTSGDKRRRKAPSSRRARNTFVTKNGQTIKIHRNISERIQANRDARARKRATRLAGMPKTFFGRVLYRMHPKRLYKYWFSREGGIMALKIFGIGIIAGFLILVGVFAYFRKDLPNLKDISGQNLGGSIRYYDKTGQTLLWEDYDAVKRIPVQDNEISPYMKDATVAVEDKDFFKHGGFDVRGIARAGVNDVFGKGGQQGGSTITQQLVKLNNNWTNNKTYVRKIKEIILSVELERSYTKQEILTGYLNAAPYGNVQYGVEAASRDYFQKSAKDLTIDEAAFMAAIPKSPSYYSPYGPYYDAPSIKDRQHYIINLMLEQHMITQKQHDDAMKVDTLAGIHTPQPKYNGMKAPYFVLTAKEELEAKYGADVVNRGGWKVTTTLDLNLQNIAETQVTKGLRQVKNQKGNQIAFAAEDVKTGQMVALVGNVMFDSTQPHGMVNYARQKLSPGSSIKPYSYATLINTTTNFGAGSVLYDTQGPLPGYPCIDKSPPNGTSDANKCLWDYDRRFPGPLTLRYALGASRNVPAVKAMLTAGIDKVQASAKSMMDSPGSTVGEARGDYKCYSDVAKTVEQACGAASGIGDGAYLKLDEHVHGFATLDRNGLNLPQTYILKIQDGSGKTIDEWKPSKGVQTVRPDAAYIVDDMLSDPNASYFTNKPHRYKGWKFSLKTGTTNDQKDGWLLGFSTQYAAGVWVGNGNNTPMTGAMENMTQPIWQGWMDQVHSNLKPEERARPSDLKVLPAYVIRSHVEYGTVEPSPANDLYPSWYQPPGKTSSSTKTIDQVSNKLATDCTPARARKDITGANANSFSGDKFVGAGAANTTESDDVHKCDDALPSIHILSSNSTSVTVQVSGGTHPLSSDQFPGTVSIVIDGQTVQSYPVSNATGQPMVLSYNYSGNGSKTVTVTVVDSVLYDASDSATVNFSATAALAITSAKMAMSGDINFLWSGGTGTVTIFNASGVALCHDNDGSCKLNGPTTTATVGTSVYAKDADGNQSPNVTVSGP